MKKYILLVDSVGKTKLELSIYLKKYNIEIIHVKDVISAIGKILEYNKQIKIVFWSIDVEPFLELEYIEKFKNNDYCKDIPLVIASVYKQKKYVIKAVKAGAVDYITKPFNEELVIKKISDLIDIPTVNKKMGFIEETNENDERLILSLQDILSIHLKGMSRANYSLSLLMLKLISNNDSVEYKKKQAINHILKAVKTKLRETDAAIRHGTDTILLILPYADKEGARYVDKKIREYFAESAFINQKAEGLILATNYVAIPEDARDQEDIMMKLHSELQPVIYLSKQNF